MNTSDSNIDKQPTKRDWHAPELKMISSENTSSGKAKMFTSEFGTNPATAYGTFS